MNAAGRDWQDKMLRAAARGRVSLAVETHERTRADRVRRVAA